MKKYIFILVMLCFSALAGCPPAKVTQQKIEFLCKKHIFEQEIYYKEFTVELFRQALIYAEIRYPEIVYRQAVLETGNFTSEIFRYGKNCFGMKLARYRCMAAVGESRNHALYVHWWDSVMDYKYWQDYFARLGYNINDYLAFLQEIQYAVDTQYINKLMIDIS